MLLESDTCFVGYVDLLGLLFLSANGSEWELF